MTSTKVSADTWRTIYGKDTSKEQSPSLTPTHQLRLRSLQETLIVRMPTAVHEAFLHDIEYDILSQLRGIGNVDIARNIKSTGSADINLGENAPKRSPDGSFKCNGSQYPHLVIEVSYSQKRKDLD